MSPEGSLSTSSSQDSAHDGRRFTMARAVAVLGTLTLVLGAALLFGLTVGSTSVGVRDLFFPSSAAVNPALTIMANALRVADHLRERLA